MNFDKILIGLALIVIAAAAASVSSTPDMDDKAYTPKPLEYYEALEF